MTRITPYTLREHERARRRQMETTRCAECGQLGAHIMLSQRPGWYCDACARRAWEEAGR